MPLGSCAARGTLTLNAGSGSATEKESGEALTAAVVRAGRWRGTAVPPRR
jgi:hypothetical protein